MTSILGYINVEPGDCITSLMWAVMCSNLETVKEIIHKGVDVNEVSTFYILCCKIR